MCVAQVAVADHRDVHRALELGDLRPVRAAFVELLRGARVQGQGLHPDGLRALGDLDEDQVLLGPAQAHLHRHRAVDGLDHGPHDGLAAVDVAQAGAAALGLRHLGRRAAEVDVDDVGPALAHQLAALAMIAGSLPQSWVETGCSTPCWSIISMVRCVAVLQGVGGHELGHGQPEPEGLVERAQGTVRHPRHRGENDGGPELDRADPKRRNDAGHDPLVYHAEAGPSGPPGPPRARGRRPYLITCMFA